MAENVSRDDVEKRTVIIADEMYAPTLYSSDPVSYFHWTKDISSGIKSLSDQQLLEICGFIIHAFTRNISRIDTLVDRLKAILGETGDEHIRIEDGAADEEDDFLCDMDISWEFVRTKIMLINNEFNIERDSTVSDILQLEPLDKPKAMFIVVDIRIDPSGTLRQWLLDKKDCGTQLHSDDSFSIKNSNLDGRRINTAEIVKKCYYPLQKNAAEIVMKRITFILKEYHNITLNDFIEFDFRIYTANSLMLETQTKKRLRERGAGCLDPREYENEQNLKTVIDSKVFKYVTDRNSKKDLEQLKEKAKQNPKKFILIVADEAHWGVSHGASSANKKYIDDWNDVEYPNVFVLQVTATPWTLLTENSKLDCEKYVADDKQNNLIAVKEVRNRLFTRRTNKQVGAEVAFDVNGTVGPKKQLHIIKWTETYDYRLKGGLFAYIRIPQNEGTDPLWLMLGNTCSTFELHPWTGVRQKESATPVLLEGILGKVKISCQIGDKKEKYTLVFCKLHVGFATDTVKQRLAEKNASCDKFSIVMNYNENLFELEPSTEQQLLYKESDNIVVISPRKAPNISDDIGIPGYHEKEYMFIIEPLTDSGQLEADYLSLNFFCNSMRNKNICDKLIRGDESFQKMINSKEFRESNIAPDQALAAEYGYYIILLNAMNNLTIATNKLEEHFESTFLQYVNKRNDQLKAIKKKIQNEENNHENNSSLKAVPVSAFLWVVEYLEDRAETELIKGLEKPNYNLNRFLDILLNYILNAGKKVYSKISRDIRKCIDFSKFKFSDNQTMINEFTRHKTEVLCRSETYKIVNGLVDNSLTINGRLNIVRLADISMANQFYVTIVFARQIGCIQNEYSFEIIRYYAKFELSSEHHNKAVHRIWQVLQRKECSYVEKKSQWHCNCSSYSPSEHEIECSNCHHRHTIIKHFSDLDRLPCIVIVVKKGRVGDTYPPSFSAMDLRVRQLGTVPTLNALVQELGRLCRYQSKDDATKLPYALVGPEALNEATKKLRNCAVATNLLYNGAVDGYTRKTKRRKNLKDPNNVDEDNHRAILNPRRYHFNAGNKEKHYNRLLFAAEPQVGKTGVYLRTIYLLRKAITVKQRMQDLQALESDNDSAIQLIESDTEEDFTPDLIPEPAVDSQGAIEILDGEGSNIEITTIDSQEMDTSLNIIEISDSDDESSGSISCLLKTNISAAESHVKSTVEVKDPDNENAINLSQDEYSEQKETLADRQATPFEHNESEANCMYPYWKNMMDSNQLEIKFKHSKYCRIYGPYQHNIIPEYRSLVHEDSKNTIKSNYIPEKNVSNLNALSFDDHRLSTCVICKPPT